MSDILDFLWKVLWVTATFALFYAIPYLIHKGWVDGGKMKDKTK